MKLKVKKRNPQDSTLRNVTAAQRKLRQHEIWIRRLFSQVETLERHLYKRKLGR